jgi:hypothetical protein
MSDTKSFLKLGAKSANRMTLRERIALEVLLKIHDTPSYAKDSNYMANYAAEDAVHAADQLLRCLNNEEPKLGAVNVYKQKLPTDR